MSLHLRPATTADVPAMVDIYFSAFHDSPITQTVFPPSSPQSARFWTDMLLEETADPHAHFAVVVPDGQQTPIAFAKWLSPKAAEQQQQPMPPAWPAAGDPAFADVFFSGLARHHDAAMRGTPHWYLELIATRAEHQGRGAAGLLMRWGLAMVDGDCAVAFLEATAGAKPVYQRFGFETVDRAEFPLPDGRVVSQDFMTRKAKERQKAGGKCEASSATVGRVFTLRQVDN